VDLSLPAARVIRSLGQTIEWRGKPMQIRSDHSPDFISQALAAWAKESEIELLFMQPINPQQNAYVERFNRTVRFDWLAHYLFENMEEVQQQATNCIWTYNNDRPNMGIVGVIPKQKLALNTVALKMSLLSKGIVV